MFIIIKQDINNPEKTLTNKIIDICKDKKFNKINIVCIGSDVVIGDSLGTLVGTLLEKNLKIMNLLKYMEL